MSNQEPLQIGGLLFNEMDQADFTGPFEVLSRVPDSRFHVIGKTLHPVRDAKNLLLTPQMTFAEAPPLDVLLVPGGAGVNAMMQDAGFIDFIRMCSAKWDRLHASLPPTTRLWLCPPSSKVCGAGRVVRL